MIWWMAMITPRHERRATWRATRRRVTQATLRAWWLGHGVPLLAYAALSVGLSWPTVQHFTTSIPSDGVDARHQLWQLWHVQQAVLGNQPLFYAPLLYYPLGATLLTHASGPIPGLLALPFWAWGPEAAYNGALLVSHWLTGYSMYLLARSLGFESGVALFAGVVLMTAPIRLVATLGQLEKVFLGLLPLGLLTLHRALNPAHSPWWTMATALVLLLTLLHSGYQFVYAGLSLGFFLIASLLSAGRAQVRRLWRRGLILAGATLIMVGPLLLAIVTAARDPAIAVDRVHLASYLQPDLIQFLVPHSWSLLFGLMTAPFFDSEIHWDMDKEVYVSWIGMVLCLVALIRGDKRARCWILFLSLCVLLALGPSLKILGRDYLAESGMPIVLPYAFLTALPGFEFMRSPGRFMLIGAVGLGISASFGLAYLIQRLPRWRGPITAVVIATILVESWPQPWPEERLRPVPEFYRQIAREDELYGVLDLPIKLLPSSPAYVMYSSHYQMYQMSHRKGIAAGYLARTYARHPLFPCLFSFGPRLPDVLVDGEPVNCYANAEVDLARHGYRYVVWHKPQPWYPDYTPDSWGDVAARELVQAVFGDQAPLVEDELVRVYAITSTADPTGSSTRMELLNNWREAEAGWRWATSPAALSVTSPRQQAAVLQITPDVIHDPTSPTGVGEAGVLTVRVGDASTSVAIARAEATTVPLVLRPGTQTITLTLEAGNFRPITYGQPDPALLSFAIRSIDLQTLHDGASTADVSAYQLPRQEIEQQRVTVHD